MAGTTKLVSMLLLAAIPALAIAGGAVEERREDAMTEISETADRLRGHLEMLTVTIGDRSPGRPGNMEKAAEYIESVFREIGLEARRHPYPYLHHTVCNVEAEISFSPSPSKRYLIGAHYDSVFGTVGADDNASAVAVMLETARSLASIPKNRAPDVAAAFAAFALEEPPAFGTEYMGSRVYAQKAKRERERIDGMICLEMVGYTCKYEGCQDYPFPLMFMGYPKVGNFVGIVGNFASRHFTKALHRSFETNPELPAIKLTVPMSGRLLPAVRLSDHSSFWDNGFKAVMVTDTAFFRNPYYHTRLDTMEKLDCEFMAQLVESLTAFFMSHASR